jgi:hypothetical protein
MSPPSSPVPLARCGPNGQRCAHLSRCEPAPAGQSGGPGRGGSVAAGAWPRASSRLVKWGITLSRPVIAKIRSVPGGIGTVLTGRCASETAPITRPAAALASSAGCPGRLAASYSLKTYLTSGAIIEVLLGPSTRR